MHCSMSFVIHRKNMPLPLMVNKDFVYTICNILYIYYFVFKNHCSLYSVAYKWFRYSTNVYIPFKIYNRSNFKVSIWLGTPISKPMWTLAFWPTLKDEDIFYLHNLRRYFTYTHIANTVIPRIAITSCDTDALLFWSFSILIWKKRKKID